MDLTKKYNIICTSKMRIEESKLNFPSKVILQDMKKIKILGRA